eukprot:4463675-Pleurochrysis_carterae.AAC.3
MRSIFRVCHRACVLTLGEAGYVKKRCRSLGKEERGQKRHGQETERIREEVDGRSEGDREEEQNSVFGRAEREWGERESGSARARERKRCGRESLEVRGARQS